MSGAEPRQDSRRSYRGMVASADQRAASIGARLLDQGGSAADAAVGAGAAMAVIGPHFCGLGGDMLAVVHPPGEAVASLLGAGRAGSGVDADGLRAGGSSVMPLRHDARSITVPGAVDGWLALHARFGRLPLPVVLEPAVALAEEGFAASTILALASHLVAGLPGSQELCHDGPLEIGQLVRLPGIARTLRTIALEGRDGFYQGEFGRELQRVGDGVFTGDDLRRPIAEWVEPLPCRVWGHDVWTVPPPSQGYLTAAGSRIAEMAALPVDPDDPSWAHVMVEAARAAGHDRPESLFDGADGQALVAEDRLAARAARIERSAAAPPDVRGPGGAGRAGVARLADGDTTHLCALDRRGLGVSLTQSNALDFGSHLVAGSTGIFLHNRGVGFSLEPGHPAELAPGRRPPHTLSPAVVTRTDGSLALVIGTMGGDAQPQILQQLLARILVAGQEPAVAVAAPRVVLDSPSAGPFRLWWGRDLTVAVEGRSPGSWAPALEAAGHRVRAVGSEDPGLGHAQVIANDPPVGSSRASSGPVGPRPGAALMTGGSDPRSPEGGAVGL